MEDDGPICLSPLNLRDDGCLIYYRDARETSKTLTEEERKEMQIKDNVRFENFATFYPIEQLDNLTMIVLGFVERRTLGEKKEH